MTCKNATLPEILELSLRLEDADPGVRRLALIELADLELPEALPLLIAALRGDPDPGVRGPGYQNQPPRDSSCWQLRYWAPNSEARDWTFCETFFSHGLAS